MITVAIILCALFVAFFVAYIVSRLHLRHIKEYERHSNEFYKSSKALITDAGTPKRIINLLLFINYKMPKRSSARQFLVSVLRRGTNAPSMRNAYDEINEFFASRPELEEAFERSCMSAMYALSYRSLFYGFLIRRLFLFDAGDSRERPAQLVAQLSTRVDDCFETELAPA